ncbi:hypothetical protein [Paraflavitalea pollutisoli]|uniref:hypothetical protein n=1 Tax=Paraflavitalea pollutisoli TaxID=3034143 RepID=UPI0023EE1AD7|nr:hypothetical protein [Paraflavitalea sp. H1-2-19X]
MFEQLAYGYHNYAFGNPSVNDPLENDDPLFLENYALAGAIYTTPAELFTFHRALQQKQLLREPAYSLLYGIDSLRSRKDNRGYWVSPGGYIGMEKIGATAVLVIERNGNIIKDPGEHTLGSFLLSGNPYI